MKRNYTILAIDTSCDETSVSVTADDRIISNVVYSQVKLHKKWGGVVPMLAKRAHEQKIDFVINKALGQAKTNLKKTVFGQRQSLSLQSIDAVAVTIGPGLAPALEVGIRKAKQLASKFSKPLIAVNHMEGHLLSPFAKNSKGKGSYRFRIKFGVTKKTIQDDKTTFPFLGLLISGGHTQLVLVNNIGDYKLLGETLDDAIGEAFDKVSKLLDLGYPGGPIIEKLAESGDEHKYDLPIPMKGRKDLMFSYSGLKTAVRYLIRDLKKENSLDRQTTSDMAASFQRVATLSLIDRLERTVKQYKPNGILLGGGVVSNMYVRNTIRTSMSKQKVPVYIPYSKKLFTDNAGMIGISAYHQSLRGDFVKNINSLDRQPNLNFHG